MSDVKPILSSGPMVRALLDGRKTQTRRVLQPQPPKDELGYEVIGTVRGPEWYHPAVVGKDGELEPGKQVWGVYDDWGEWGARVPYMPGDLLWVRERWSDEYLAPGEAYYYATAVEDGLRADEVAEIRWRPSIHMPRWASRITLEVTDVRVHRLQDISYDDAIAEGIEPVDEFHAGNKRWRDYLGLRSGCSSPILSFSTLWNALYAKPKPIYSEGRIVSYVSYPWDGESRVETYRGLPHEIRPNPFVIALTFVVHQMNIDDFLAQREAA